MSVYVDIPTNDCIGRPDGSFKNVGQFNTRREAIAFCIAHFGADEQGRVQLVSGADEPCEGCDDDGPMPPNAMSSDLNIPD